MSRHASTPVLSPETMLLPAIEERIGEGTPHVMGRVAVDHLRLAHAYRANADYFHYIGDAHMAAETAQRAEHHSQETVRLIGEIRKKVDIPEDARRPLLLSYLESLMGNEFVAAKTAGAPHSTIADWLRDDKRGATDGQVYDFVFRHVKHIEAQEQSPEVREVIGKTKASYISGIRRGVREGWLSEHALQAIPKIQDCRVLIGDMWDTHLADSQGYQLNGQSYVVVGQGYKTSSEECDILEAIRRVLPHELGHVAFDNERALPEWFYEPMAEHVRLSIAEGQPDIMHPDQRKQYSNIYPTLRIFMATITQKRKKSLFGGSQNHLLRLAMRAYSSPLESDDWYYWLQGLDEAWGPQAFETFMAAITQEQQRQQAPGQPRKQALFAAVRQQTQRIEQLQQSRMHIPRQRGVSAPLLRFARTLVD